MTTVDDVITSFSDDPNLLKDGIFGLLPQVLFVMLPLFAVMLGQKLITAPQRWSVAVALGFAAVAVAVAGTAVFD